MTFLSSTEIQPLPGGIEIDLREVAKVEAERKRLGITDAELERRRRASVEQEF